MAAGIGILWGVVKAYAESSNRKPEMRSGSPPLRVGSNQMSDVEGGGGFVEASIFKTN